MLFASSLVASAFLISAVLAERRRLHQSNLQNRVAHRNFTDTASDNGAELGTNWAGAVLNEAAGTFYDIKGSLVIPVPEGSADSVAYIWVGIDGYTCPNAALQTGIEMIPDGNGGGTYGAWYQWHPDSIQYFSDSDMPISPGDTVTLSVKAYSSTVGAAIIQNLANGHVSQTLLTSDFALCGRNAEWVVEVPSDQLAGNPFTLANFGTVQFSDAVVGGQDSGMYSPDQANIVNILSQDGDALTYVSTDESFVTITYL